MTAFGKCIAAGALAAWLWFGSAAPAAAVEHPGTIPRGAECFSCHASKINGKSVHSAMVAPCTVCHISMTQGDMTSMSLLMPKNRICYACHSESVALKQHTPDSKKQCLECHDAHSSDSRMLLRADAAKTSVLKRTSCGKGLGSNPSSAGSPLKQMPLQEVGGPGGAQAKQLSSKAWGSARTPPETHSELWVTLAAIQGWKQTRSGVPDRRSSDAILVFAGWRSFMQVNTLLQNRGRRRTAFQ